MAVKMRAARMYQQENKPAIKRSPSWFAKLKKSAPKWHPAAMTTSATDVAVRGAYLLVDGTPDGVTVAEAAVTMRYLIERRHYRYVSAPRKGFPRGGAPRRPLPGGGAHHGGYAQSGGRRYVFLY